MAWRIRKSIKIARGVRVNLSRRGASASVGGGGLTWTSGKLGGAGRARKHADDSQGGALGGCLALVALIFVGVIVAAWVF